MKAFVQPCASLVLSSMMFCLLAGATAATVEPKLPSPSLPTATHQCPANCLPGTALPVTAVFEYHGYLTSFAWYPILPSGWSVGIVKGSGQPIVNASGAIVFTGPIPSSPIRLTYYVQVPAEASGTNLLRGRVAYQYGTAPHVLEIPETWALPDPLMVIVRPALVPAAPWTLVWQQPNGPAAIWEMDGTQILNSAALSSPLSGPDWRLASARDVNGDNHMELRWQHTDGWVATACLEGATCTGVSYLNPDRVGPGWRLAVSADLNNDGEADILWQHTNGEVSVWYMKGTNRIGGGFLTVTNSSPGWKLVGSGHFGGSGVDLLWQHDSGYLVAWFMGKGLTPTAITPLNPGQVDPNWRLAATQDLNRDGYTELIWQHSSGLLIYWVMNGNTRIGGGLLNLDPVLGDWQIVGPR